MTQPLLEMKGITKEFPGVKALDNVDLVLYKKEGLALLGENGAGKSTLMKILAGAYQPDAGEILIEGRKAEIADPSVSRELGISIIYQEFNLIPYLSIAENIFLGRIPEKAKGIVNWKLLNQNTEELLKRVGLAHLQPKQLVASLSVAEQQLIEIAKAISYASKLIIMDEPTAALNDEDTKRLLILARELKEQGIGIIFITHRLEEIAEIADRITVLRDGKYIGSEDVKNVTKDQMVSMMVGRDINDLYPQVTSETIGETVLAVKDLSLHPKLQGVNLELKAGEILGVAGLIGSGKTELSRTLFGLNKKYTGEINLNGQEIKTPRDAIDAGIALVTDDRKQEGLVLGMSVYENLLLPSYRKLSKWGVLQKKNQSEVVNKWVNQINIKVHDPKVEVRTLSGGNQQKVVLGKWLQMNPKVLILNEPTRGIDVGAKAEIYRMIKQLTEQKIGIILISSEMPELLGMCHRIMVLSDGKKTGELSREEATQEKIFHLASGGEVHGTIK